ncbi:MAG: class I SAM-dependent methyltransferase [bacterium]|nr:class I SAM-dependent methyltransferase [bacterium]
MTTEQNTIYDNPRYYEIAFSPDIEREAVLFYQVFERMNPDGIGRVLEFGAGSGRLASELAGMGVPVVGLDLDETMAAFGNERAREQNLDYEIIVGDICDFCLGEGTFDNAFCAVETIRYTLEEERLLAHLDCAAQALKPGGIYCVETYFVGKPDEYPGESGRWTVARDGVQVRGSVITYQVDWENRVEPVHHILEITDDGGEPFFLTLDAAMHAYSWYDYKALIKENGRFEIAAVLGPGYDPAHSIKPTWRTREAVLVLRKV